MEEKKKYAKVYVNRDGSMMRLNKMAKLIVKFKGMNFIEQQNILMSIQKHLKPKPTKDHTFHFFISKRGKPHNA